jgi:hypothetical protein
MPVLIIQILSLIVSFQYHIRITKPRLSSVFPSLISPTRKPQEQRRSDAALPLRSNRILNDEWIGSQQHAIVLNGLANQHPIERVAAESISHASPAAPIETDRGRPASEAFPANVSPRSHTPTLSKISWAGSANIFAAVRESSREPAMIHKKVPVSKRHLTPSRPRMHRTCHREVA